MIGEIMVSEINKGTVVSLVGAGLLSGGILWYLGDNNYLDVIPVNQDCRGKDQSACTSPCNWYPKYFYPEGCYDVAPDDLMRYVPIGLMGVGAIMTAFGLMYR